MLTLLKVDRRFFSFSVLKRLAVKGHRQAYDEVERWLFAHAELIEVGQVDTDFGVIPEVVLGPLTLSLRLYSICVYLGSLPMALANAATERCPWCDDFEVFDVHETCNDEWLDYLAEN